MNLNSGVLAFGCSIMKTRTFSTRLTLPTTGTRQIWLPCEMHIPHFETVEEIQSALQKVLDTLKERDFHGASQMWQEHC